MAEYPSVAELVMDGGWFTFSPTLTTSGGYWTDDLEDIASAEAVPVSACWIMQQESLVMEVNVQ